MDGVFPHAACATLSALWLPHADATVIAGHRDRVSRRKFLLTKVF
jgi:hypothetical protein